MDRRKGVAAAAVVIGEVPTFSSVMPDKVQAVKVLEESAELFAAWQNWYANPDSYEVKAFMDEAADVIQAACNLVQAVYNVDQQRDVDAINFQSQVFLCKQRNKRRGRVYQNEDTSCRL